MFTFSPKPRVTPRIDGAAGLTLFATAFVPALWGALIQTFGTTVSYTPVSGQVMSLIGLWKEGTEGEPSSPGSYSVFDVQDSDIPNGPMGGDLIYEPSRGNFKVQRVDAFAVGYSRLTLKEKP